MDLEFFVHASLAGLLATYLHLVAALWADRYGLPRIDLPRGMAQLTFGDSFEGPAPYGWGIAVIHANGIAFALLYAGALAQYLPGEPYIKGLIFGAILYFGAMLVFVPFFLRDGFFGARGHPMGWLTALVIHLIYGLILGWLSPVL